MKKNNVALRILMLFMSVTLLASSFSIEINADNKTPGSGTQNYIEWKRVKKYSDLPQTSDDPNTYYMLLAWCDNNEDPNSHGTTEWTWCINSPFRQDNKSIRGIRYNDPNWAIYRSVFDISKDTFVTTSSFGMPRIKYRGEDKDNENKPMYTIQLENGMYLLDDGNDNFKFRTNESDKWGVAVKEEGEKARGYEESAKYDGCVSIYYNDNGGYDSGFIFHGTQLTDEEKLEAYFEFDPFYMWIGREKTYTVITEDFEITPRNIFNAKDGLIIDQGVKVTVDPGAVFSVEGCLINNGYVYNYGTVVLQKNASMFPMVKGVNLLENVNRADGKYEAHISFVELDGSANNVTCYGSQASKSVEGYKKPLMAEGNLLIEEGARLGFSPGMGELRLLKGAHLENRGLMVMSGRFTVIDSMFLNYGLAYVGCNFFNMAAISSIDILYMRYHEEKYLVKVEGKAYSYMGKYYVNNIYSGVIAGVIVYNEYYEE